MVCVLWDPIRGHEGKLSWSAVAIDLARSEKIEINPLEKDARSYKAPAYPRPPTRQRLHPSATRHAEHPRIIRLCACLNIDSSGKWGRGGGWYCSIYTSARTPLPVTVGLPSSPLFLSSTVCKAVRSRPVYSRAAKPPPLIVYILAIILPTHHTVPYSTP